MNKQEPPNPFEHLKIEAPAMEIVDPWPEIGQHSITITTNKEETATILTKQVGQFWCGGFTFYWHHNNVSYKMPDPANGIFRTEREAQLYYIAYLSLFMDYYLDDTKEAINNALNEYSQQNLFE